MKNRFLFLGLLAHCAALVAADITLPDGRILRDASVVSQTARSVTIKHAGGLSSVAKTALPAELRVQYPFDAAAARAADAQAAETRARADAKRQAEAKRIAGLQAERAAAVAQNAKAAEADETRRQELAATVPQIIQTRAEQAFVDEYKSFRSLDHFASAEVKVLQVTPVDGWPGRWRAQGLGSARFSQSLLHDCPRHSLATELRHRRLEPPKCTCLFYNRSFEAEYSASDDSLSLSWR